MLYSENGIETNTTLNNRFMKMLSKIGIKWVINGHVIYYSWGYLLSMEHALFFTIHGASSSLPLLDISPII